MVKICFVAHYCIPHIGGIESISFEEAYQLTQIGYDVTIFGGQTHGEANLETLYGVKIRRLRAWNFLESRFGIPYPIFSPQILEVLYGEISNSDIVLIQSFGFLSSFVAALICVQLKIPYILYQHNPFTPFRNSLVRGIQHSNDFLLGKYILSHASRILAISEHVSSYTKKISGKKAEVLYSGVDYNRFCPNRSKAKLRDRIGIKPEKFIVLTVRRLVYKNSISTLLETANLLRDDNRFQFIIIGHGAERNLLERFIQTNELGNCLITGEVAPDILVEYYQVADVFVLPSKSEGLGIVVLEAMASGLPIIATNVGGQTEIIQITQNGFLVNVDQPEQIAANLKQLINNPRECYRIGQVGRELVIQKFNWSDHVKKLDSIIKETIYSHANCVSEY